jgi:hypothetical protein
VENELCFVQFIHPGGEHRPDNGRFKGWNRSSHKRKFLKNSGRYLHEGKLEEGEIVCWAEWEPESEVVKEIDDPFTNGPRYIYRPYYVVPPSYEGLQNTDPFIFGEQFYYEGCQQRTKNGPTQLRYLARGSVLLFGSCVNQSDFVLDTVFVVDDWIEHSRSDFRERLVDAVPEAYKDVTISPWYQESFGEKKGCIQINASESWRLYFGATYEHLLNGMFSFFPCLPYEGEKGFARPRIRIRGVITDNLSQGKKLNPQESLHDVKTLWDEVAKQVEEQGLRLGVFTGIPCKSQIKTLDEDGTVSKQL